MIRLIVICFLFSLHAYAQPMKYLALGDSYTIGESVAPEERWPMQLAYQLRQQGKDVEGPTIIATTGWRTDNLQNGMTIARLQPEYDLVSLLIGVNNQYQGRPLAQYQTEFEALLREAIRLAKGNKANVFVVSIPDYGYTPFGQPRQEKISRELDAFNEANRALTEQLGVTYVYITDISRQGLQDPALVAADGLHPSGKMYGLWVARILESLR